MSARDGKVTVGTNTLTLKQVINVARQNALVELTEETRATLSRGREELNKYIQETFDWLETKTPEQRESPAFKLERKQKMMYGVTTGFGEHKTDYMNDPDKAKRLQENVVASHASGVGPAFDPETTRAIMLLRANTLALGHSGVSPDIVKQLVSFLNNGIYPSIPEQGSVGASGDLAPLAHLALALIGKAPVKHEGREKRLEKLKRDHPELDINPGLELLPKDGLALVNGLTVMTGIGVLAYADAENLVEWADAIGAVTTESVLGSSRAFDEAVFTVYGHEGAKISAGRVRDMISGSNLINRSTDIHDPYSVRCIPQVHGAVRDLLRYVKTTLENQLNSVDDDPIVFTASELEHLPAPLDSLQPPERMNADGWKNRRHFEQGNFHGEPIAFAMDMLAIGVAELGSISERRTQMLLDKNHSRGLPSCLVDNPDGVNSGHMIAQYAAAALVSENKGLCHPASVDSIPTSANSEDHVSMGTIAARKARKVIENVTNILAIELLCATEALSFRLGEQEVTDHETGQKKKLEISDRRCGTRTRNLYEKVRTGPGRIPILAGNDTILHTLIDRARKEFLSKSLFEFIGEPRSEQNSS
ncbi:MAG TPA: aromatic amino acid lyase [Blastocatellia bacterium]|nr:aromatic amino acid lyase [Blastocatellia bacterium]